MRLRTLFDSSEMRMPVKGMVSAGTPVTTPPGYWKEIYDLRLTDRTPVVRGATRRIGLTTLPLSGTITILGAREFTVNGTQYVLVAAHGSSSAYGVIVKMNVSSGVMTELTAGSGQYGNTRLGDYTDQVQMTVVSDPDTSRDYVVFSNGKSPARIWDEANSIMSIHYDIPAPSSIASYAYYMPTNYFKIYGKTISWTNFDGDLVMASDASPANYFTLTIQDDVDPGDYGKNSTAFVGSDNTNPVDATANGYEARQIWVWGEGPTEVWDNCKLSVSENGSTFYDVHDPTKPTGNLSSGIVVTDTANDRHILWCDIQQIDSSHKNALAYIKVEWVTTSPGGGGSTLYDYKIYAIAFGGQVPSTSRYAFSYRNNASQAESPAVEVSKYAGEKVSGMGGAYDYEMPRSPDLYCRFNIQLPPPMPDSKDSGTDYAQLYRIDAGETKFSFIRDYKQCSYSGGTWSYVGGFVFSLSSFFDNLKREDKRFNKEARQSGEMNIPIAAAIETIGERVWCGNILDGPSCTITAATAGTTTVIRVSNNMGYRTGNYITISGATGSHASWAAGMNGTFRIIKVYQGPLTGYSNLEIALDSSGFSGTYTGSSGTGIGQRRRGLTMFSWKGKWNLFSLDPRPSGVNGIDNTSASSFVINGERVTKFSAITIFGIDHILMWTDRWFYQTGGVLTSELSRIQALGPHGTTAPYSVARYNMDVYWVDCRGQIRHFPGGEANSLTWQTVDDNLIASADITKCSAGVFKETYRVAFIPSGATTHTRQIVYDERYSALHGPKTGITIDRFPDPATGGMIVCGIFSGVEKQYLISENGALYEFDITGNSTYTTDLGSLISWKLSKEIAPQEGIGGLATWKRIRVICDAVDNASAVINVTKTLKPNGDVFSGTIQINSASGQIVRYEVPSADPAVDALYGSGCSCLIELSGTGLVSSACYAIEVEEFEESPRGDSSES